MPERLHVAVRDVRAHGYEVVTGECLSGSGRVDAPAADRTRELMAMLNGPTMGAVMPPWSGETALGLIPLLGWVRPHEAETT